VTGGVLERGLEEIGDEDVDVPKYYYKIVAKGTADNMKVIAFLMPNYESSNSLGQFVVPIDKIEKMTGLDFFHNLPDSYEVKLESTSSLVGWKF